MIEYADLLQKSIIINVENRFAANYFCENGDKVCM